jgi:hypothetical protein
MGRGRKTVEGAGPRDVRGAAQRAAGEAAQRLKRRRLLEALTGTLRHFCGGFSPLVQDVADPRQAVKVVYPLPAMPFTGMRLFLFRLGARRRIGWRLRDNAISAAGFHALWGVASSPHGDTLEDVAQRLEPDQVQEAVRRVVETLIRRKVLYNQRLLDRHHVVAVDATGVLWFDRRHCPHCPTQTKNGVTRYYHGVPEAKLVTPAGPVFSLMTEFIENLDPGADKQDCELKAFQRLAARLKRRFPRLPISLCADGLYAGGPVFDLCRRYDWRFMITLKEAVPFLAREFEALSPLQLLLTPGAPGRPPFFRAPPAKRPDTPVGPKAGPRSFFPGSLPRPHPPNPRAATSPV